ncbi:MAG: hypothetical protein IPM42_13740 [Saprospiraceae bacterium]|nr:hypothetical protein [Saprospiraceae bacterium]
MKTLSIFIFLILFLSCKSVDFNPSNKDINYLHFGSGGGFTGVVSSWYLTDAGLIYKEEDGKFTKIKSIKKESARQVFSNFTSVGLDNLALNDPGNRYYFIEKNYSGNSHKIIWGGKNQVDTNPELLYQILNHLLKQ